MTHHNINDLDPASDRTLNSAERRRADALFERIIATPAQPAARPATPRAWYGRRGVQLAGAAAAVTLVVGGTAHSPTVAYASWTADPTVLATQQAVELGQQCAESWDNSIDWPAVVPEDILLSERRGESSLTLMRQGQTIIECTDLGAGGHGWSAVTDEYGTVPTVNDDQIITLTRGSNGNWPFEYSSATGIVGSDVTAVDLVSADGNVVQASVAGGWFTAWWPGGLGDGNQTVTVHTSHGSKSFEMTATFRA